MESSYVNFDNESKQLIEELAKNGKKFNNLISKLQVAKETIDKDELIQALTEELKK